jgi:hypothetical protein
MVLHQFDTVQIEYTTTVIPSDDLRLFNSLSALAQLFYFLLKTSQS